MRDKDHFVKGTMKEEKRVRLHMVNLRWTENRLKIL